MTRWILVLIFLVAAGRSSAGAADQRIVKVLPHLLDRDSRHAVSPSLFDRDAYQAWLRDHPEEQTGIRYDVKWRSIPTTGLTLKLELLGRVEEGRPNRKTIEVRVTPTRGGSRWSELSFTGEEFKSFGPIIAWRVSIWEDGSMVAHQQSFLWN